MLTTKTRATLIRRSLLTETSLILHWCSDEAGIVKTVAKGARRPGSQFSGKLDLFFRCEIEIVPARKGDLHILKDIEVLDPRLGLRKTWLQTLAASYFVKLIEKVVELESPIPEIAGLLDRALDYLNNNRPDRRAVLHFEKQLAKLLGVEDENHGPAESIADTFGDLPKQRVELLEKIE